VARLVWLLAYFEGLMRSVLFYCKIWSFFGFFNSLDGFGIVQKWQISTDLY